MTERFASVHTPSAFGPGKERPSGEPFGGSQAITAPETFPLFDTHAHLDLANFEPDRDAVIARAKAVGLVGVINVGFDLITSHRSVALAEREPTFFHAAVGIHPHEALAADAAALAVIERLAHSPVVVAIGEIGLDYHRDLSPRALQRDTFRRQLNLAARLNLPVIIHSREAAEDVFAILEAEVPPKGGILHSFSGDPTAVQQAVALGFYLSFSGPVTFRKATALREAVASVPADRLLLETDCPYLAPEPWRGKRNEPAFLQETAQAVARVRHLSPTAVGSLTTANIQNFLGLPEATLI